MSFNGAAWSQRHHDDYLGPVLPSQGALWRCPDCPRLLTREWWLSIFGEEPVSRDPVESPLRWAR